MSYPPQGPIYYRHITEINPRFRSRNFRQEDGAFPWNEAMQTWLDEPRVYVHRRRSISLMSALGGRKESDGI